MKQYLDLLNYILENGQERDDRTGTGTISCFGYQNRYDLSEGFPLLTTKKVAFRLIMEELLWFINGNTNITYLVRKNVNIWNEWPYKDYCLSKEYKGESIEEFIEKIKVDGIIASDVLVLKKIKELNLSVKVIVSTPLSFNSVKNLSLPLSDDPGMYG